MDFFKVELQIVSVTVHDNIEIFCISPEVYTYFSCAIINYPSGQEILLESVPSMSGNCCISAVLNVGFSGEVFGIVSTTR